MRLEAERGQVCVVGAGSVVLVTIVTPDANLGRVRLDMMKASQGKS
jgi:predicted regulator of Ras-like GTPase activity (Roadblock/LC7/MglB family)